MKDRQQPPLGSRAVQAAAVMTVTPAVNADPVPDPSADASFNLPENPGKEFQDTKIVVLKTRSPDQ